MPRLVLITGVPRAGKDWTALLSSAAAGIKQVIGTDDVRRQMIKEGKIPYESRYSMDNMNRVYKRVFALARRFLSQGDDVIIHGTFCRKENRDRAKKLAERFNALLDVILVECDILTIKARAMEGLQRGVSGPDLPAIFRVADNSEATWPVCEEIMGIFEPVEDPFLRIDGSLPSVENLKVLNGHFNADQFPLLFE